MRLLLISIMLFAVGCGDPGARFAPDIDSNTETESDSSDTDTDTDTDMDTDTDNDSDVDIDSDSDIDTDTDTDTDSDGDTDSDTDTDIDGDTDTDTDNDTDTDSDTDTDTDTDSDSDSDTDTDTDTETDTIPPNPACDANGGGPVVLIETKECPHAIVTDQSYIYYSITDDTPGGTGGKVMRLPKSAPGQTPYTLVFGENRVEVLAIDPTHIFWVDYDNENHYCTIKRKPLAGGEIQELAQTEKWGWIIAMGLQGSWLYWADTLAQSIHRVTKWGTGEETLVDNLNESITSFLVDESHTYWSSTVFPGGGLYRMPLQGGVVDQVIPVSKVSDISLVGDRIYYGLNTSDEVSVIGAVDTDGSNSVNIWSQSNLYVDNLVADQTHIYWLSGGSNSSQPGVHRVSVEGGDSTFVGSIGTEGPYVSGVVALDTGYVYWTGFDWELDFGSVVCKPK